MMLARPRQTGAGRYTSGMKLGRTCSIWWVLLFAWLAGACAGSDPGTGATAPRSTETTTSTSTSTTTTTTTTSVTPPTSGSTTTEPEFLSLVYVGPDGSDDATGAEASSAVRSVGRAVQRLAPGGTIALLPGTHPPIEIVGVNGTAELPIRIRGGAGAIVEDIDYRTGAGIQITESSHIEISGLTVRRALWGIYVSSSSDITLQGNDVADIGQEAIRVADGSRSVVIEDNRVADTGRRTDIDLPNGEGIYIGTGSPFGVDMVQDVLIKNNVIERTTDEAIDVKSPTTGIHIVGNQISDIATNTSGAVVVHLLGDTDADPDIRIEQNVIRNVTRTSRFMDGNCIVVQVTVTIVNNVLHGCQHRGIYIQGSQGIARIEHNTLLDTGEVASVESEGRGQAIEARNNLGVGGDENRDIDGSAFVDTTIGDYALTTEAAIELATAPGIGVLVDLIGRERPTEGAVTFGALEAAPS